MSSIKQLDPQLETTLRSLGHFVYFPNPGNLGDELIAVATLQVFERLGLSYEIYDDKKAYPTGYTLVYGGGGGMIPEWGYLQTIATAFSDPGISRGVILSHSMRNCEELLNILDERFTIFCRDQKSLEYCESINTKAEIHLADDMGCYLDVSALPTLESLHRQLPCPGLFTWCSSLLSENRHSQTRTLHRYYRKTYHRLNRHAKQRTHLLTDSRKLALMMRRDSEAVADCLPEKLHHLKNIDISRYGGGNCRWIEFTRMGVRQFIDTINRFDVIITDRLHVSIAAAHLRKQVIMIDNSYGKLSGVFNQSLSHLPNCHLCTSGHEVSAAMQSLDIKIPDV